MRSFARVFLHLVRRASHIASKFSPPIEKSNPDKVAFAMTKRKWVEINLLNLNEEITQVLTHPFLVDARLGVNLSCHNSLHDKSIHRSTRPLLSLEP